MLLAAAAGLAAGSFLTVVVHRLPLMLEAQWRRRSAGDDASPDAPSHPGIAAPRSHCPRCREPIPWHGLIPLAGFVLLGGRCARCRAPIPVRYPLIELLCLAGAALCAWRFGAGWPAAGAIALTWALVALAFIDLESRLLPDAITLPMLWRASGSTWPARTSRRCRRRCWERWPATGLCGSCNAPSVSSKATKASVRAISS